MKKASIHKLMSLAVVTGMAFPLLAVAVHDVDPFVGTSGTGHTTPAAVGDVSGLIGQYAHGNEPSHHVIYYFNYAGRRDLLAKYLQKTCETYYRNTPDGLCGNDDCGQMSAWYVFTCLGFYPADPCGGAYLLGWPQVEEATISVGEGRVFRICRLPDALPTDPVTLNGREIKGFQLTREQVRAGGTLVFGRSCERMTR